MRFDPASLLKVGAGNVGDQEQMGRKYLYAISKDGIAYAFCAGPSADIRSDQ